MRLEKDFADAVLAIKPNAKARLSGFATKNGKWCIWDGDELLAATFQGRKVAWQKALVNIRKGATK